MQLDIWSNVADGHENNREVAAQTSLQNPYFWEEKVRGNGWQLNDEPEERFN